MIGKRELGAGLLAVGLGRRQVRTWSSASAKESAAALSKLRGGLIFRTFMALRVGCAMTPRSGAAARRAVAVDVALPPFRLPRLSPVRSRDDRTVNVNLHELAPGGVRMKRSVITG